MPRKSSQYSLVGYDYNTRVCEKCGRYGLDGTVVLESPDGETLRYGSDCACSALGLTNADKVKAKAQKLEADRLRKAEKLEAERLQLERRQRVEHSDTPYLNKVISEKAAPVIEKLALDRVTVDDLTRFLEENPDISDEEVIEKARQSAGYSSELRERFADAFAKDLERVLADRFGFWVDEGRVEVSDGDDTFVVRIRVEMTGEEFPYDPENEGGRVEVPSNLQTDSIHKLVSKLGGAHRGGDTASWHIRAIPQFRATDELVYTVDASWSIDSSKLSDALGRAFDKKVLELLPEARRRVALEK